MYLLTYQLSSCYDQRTRKFIGERNDNLELKHLTLSDQKEERCYPYMAPNVGENSNILSEILDWLSSATIYKIWSLLLQGMKHSRTVN